MRRWGWGAEALGIAFGHWKESVPMAAPRKAAIRDDLKNTQGSQPHRMSEVMLRIIAFPVEQKTPIECMNFIAEIKQDIAKLL